MVLTGTMVPRPNVGYVTFFMPPGLLHCHLRRPTPVGLSGDGTWISGSTERSHPRRRAPCLRIHDPMRQGRLEPAGLGEGEDVGRRAKGLVVDLLRFGNRTAE
ncbi:hypothetical protein Pmi06nite_21860 [Planotetraspora mira]|uniref:Uncharacterized protein n=1 Tax=Planotetraspora mira TaxID=58121 RepID=A0A8J3X6F6_9ACTN|nr:hypothetical protein Pmi06nite_21860 [Planotetraspora mira]